MPELPEVETIVNHLKQHVVGRKVVSLRSNTPRLFRARKDFVKARNGVVGRKIEDVERVGKNIIFRLSGGGGFLIHLMMTGKLLLDPEEPRKHDRLIIHLSGSRKLVFNDIRKFGRFRLVGSEEKFVGADPLKIIPREFKKLLSGKGMRIKNFLMNQKFLAGIGNIYADEILWRAGISPPRTVDKISAAKIKKLYNSIRYVLKLAVRKGGTSSRDYLRPDGTKGGYYEIRKVYQRAGQKCSRDSGIIKRIKINGRSTHFCSKHQR